jgi:D-glycero-D-manno-heptose 1,7-bisphosphate phosphatase
MGTFFRMENWGICYGQDLNRGKIGLDVSMIGGDRMKKQPAVFMDRDGVLNADRGYICRPKELEWTQGAIEAIRELNYLGYFVFVITNQSGIARGFFQEEDVYDFHSYMEEELERKGAIVHSFYVCPHHPDGIIEKYAIRCKCRKPLPGLVEQACQEWPVDLGESFLIGGREQDLAVANGAGISGYLFSEGNLYDFVQEIIEKQRNTEYRRKCNYAL